MPSLKPDLSFRAHGKLLLSGEYFVLDGAKALALPTQLGQSLNITFTNSNKIEWRALDYDQSEWLRVDLAIQDLAVLNCNDEASAKRLQQILAQAKKQNPNFLTDYKGLQVETILEFPRKWGLGSSSTLIANLARWAKIDPYKLLENTMGGSGYDLACAVNDCPIVYWREAGKAQVQASSFNPPFKDSLYFVYLSKKQNSREGIQRYREKVKSLNIQLDTISQLSLNMERCENLEFFQELLLEHESLVAKTLELPRAQDLYFKDYWAVVKSLGAWGGDFVLATSSRDEDETKRYFNEKGFSVVLTYKEMIIG